MVYKEPKNGISVVVTTYNKKDLIHKTIESLLAQNFPTNKFEIIIVDDGSKEEHLVDVRSFQAGSSVDITYIYQKDEGFRAAKARNRGLSLAKFDRVLFLDSGILASSNLISLHSELHRDRPRDVIYGLSYGVVEFGMEGFRDLREILDNNTLETSFEKLKFRRDLYDCRYNYLEKKSLEKKSTENSWVVCWGGHFSASTIDLLQVGGFDEWFNSWGGEDVELAYRLKKHGLKFQFIPTIETIHIPHERNSIEQEANSKNNIDYIADKHKDAETDLLKVHGWEDILELLN